MKLEEYLLGKSAGQYVGFLSQYIRDRVIRRLDFTGYAIMEVMNFDEYDKGALAMMLSSEDVDVKERLLDLVDAFQEVDKNDVMLE